MSPTPRSPTRDGRHAVAVVAHSDDETLGCGGTLSKLAAEGWRVDVVIVSDGIVTARGDLEDNRYHTQLACKVLDIRGPVFLEFPDQRLDTVAMVSITHAIEALELEPDLVLTHSVDDLNIDHRVVAEAVRVAFRPAGRRVSILGAEIPGSSVWNGVSFAPNYVVDITAHLERKLQALSAYENEQRPAPHPCSAMGVEVLARYHGMNHGLEAAEAFQIVRAFEGQLP